MGGGVPPWRANTDRSRYHRQPEVRRNRRWWGVCDRQTSSLVDAIDVKKVQIKLKNVCKRWIKNRYLYQPVFNPQYLRPNRTASNYTTKFCNFFSVSSTFRKPKKLSVECSTSVVAAHWILHPRKYNCAIYLHLWEYYRIQRDCKSCSTALNRRYFVAVFSLTYTPILPTFF